MYVCVCTDVQTCFLPRQREVDQKWGSMFWSCLCFVTVLCSADDYSPCWSGLSHPTLCVWAKGKLWRTWLSLLLLKWGIYSGEVSKTKLVENHINEVRRMRLNCIWGEKKMSGRMHLNDALKDKERKWNKLVFLSSSCPLVSMELVVFSVRFDLGFGCTILPL